MLEAFLCGMIVATIVIMFVFGSNLFNSIKQLFHREYKKCSVWSNVLNQLMDNGVDVTILGRYAQLGPIKIYIDETCDYRERYGSDYDYREFLRTVPDSRTRKRLKQYVVKKRAIKIFDDALSLTYK
jgi:hypothetical protein